MLSIAICDDEEYFRITEKQLILKYMAGKNCECMIDMYESGKELLALRSAISQYNIIFLDVNMEEIDGIETAKEIRKITKDVFIVFVTAFITYALEGYKVDAVRYLIKDHESFSTRHKITGRPEQVPVSPSQCQIFQKPKGFLQQQCHFLSHIGTVLHPLFAQSPPNI